jgi:hypothetical protein
MPLRGPSLNQPLAAQRYFGLGNLDAVLVAGPELGSLFDRIGLRAMILATLISAEWA